MKKLFILIVSLALFACSTSSEPDPVPKIYLSPASTNVTVGGQVDLNILIEENQQSIFGISMQISYNNTALGFVDSTGFMPGSMFNQSAVSFAQGNGTKIHLSLSQLNGQSGTSGSGTIGTLKLNANASGNTVISILQDELYFYNSNGEQITIADLNIESASINIQ